MKVSIIMVYFGFVIVLFLSSFQIMSQDQILELDRKNILAILYKVNDYQKRTSQGSEGRNWKTGTWYTGVMAFYKASNDTSILNQAISWANSNSWQIGNEWIYPANRLTCVQTYFEIYNFKKDPAMIQDGKDYMNTQITRTEPAYLSGWDYIDALYVGAPAYAMLSEITGEKKYADFLNRVFWEVADQLFDKDEGLFYRDSEARYVEKSRNNRKVLWSRGNGWAIASLPRILDHLAEDNPFYPKYVELLKTMAASLAERQGADGLWRSNLADAEEYPMPESSGTSFFTYALAWGINEGILDREKYTQIVKKAWNGLCNVVNDEGKVCCGQLVARGPGKVSQEDSDEYVTGAFLLAGSEVLRMAGK
jgi:unsaturated rhamnogalacturonyl hydrolase